MKPRYTALSMLIPALLLTAQAQAAIGLDRTRAILDGNTDAVSMTLTNNSEQSPYLAQAWVENAQGDKITSPLVTLPPVQRINPGKQSQVRVQALPAVKALPQDRESVYYFNVREIPPKSDKPNSLQVALQTRIKLFYRPAAIVPTKQQLDNPWQNQITLKHEGKGYRVINPTPYYITLIDVTSSQHGSSIKPFEPIMVPPKDSMMLGLDSAALGATPWITYINDYGGRPQLALDCGSAGCSVNLKRTEEAAG
ncbi:molecular chaperone [Pantoea wallisii]|uniref:Molecular chaperone n=1 Tax=Pantoea wallisii TaxID=1076551 RepID=A0A1X1D165_9GAMM|nr:fimbria/pilus periplasmic chaperone [Pantoea wallisii]ORM70330.1 molecular chaperone [Pantoea wallisii]